MVGRDPVFELAVTGSVNDGSVPMTLVEPSTVFIRKRTVLPICEYWPVAVPFPIVKFVQVTVKDCQTYVDPVPARSFAGVTALSAMFAVTTELFVFKTPLLICNPATVTTVALV